MRPNNRPQKGSTIKVEPIREPKDIRLIKKLLADRSRDLAIFTLLGNRVQQHYQNCHFPVKTT